MNYLLSISLLGRSALVVLIAFFADPSCAAERGSLVFRFSNSWKYPIMVNMHSESVQYPERRNSKSWVWPEDGKAYLISPGEKKMELKIGCYVGEKVCFGAHPKSFDYPSWGAGRDGNDACENCCQICEKSLTQSGWNLVSNKRGPYNAPSRARQTPQVASSPPSRGPSAADILGGIATGLAIGSAISGGGGGGGGSTYTTPVPQRQAPRQSGISR